MFFLTVRKIIRLCSSTLQYKPVTNYTVHVSALWNYVDRTCQYSGLLACARMLNIVTGPFDAVGHLYRNAHACVRVCVCARIIITYARSDDRVACVLYTCLRSVWRSCHSPVAPLPKFISISCIISRIDTMAVQCNCWAMRNAWIVFWRWALWPARAGP